MQHRPRKHKSHKEAQFKAEFDHIMLAVPVLAVLLDSGLQLDPLQPRARLRYLKL